MGVQVSIYTKWSMLRLSTGDADDPFAFLFSRTKEMNQFISLQNFFPEFSKLWHSLTPGFSLANREIHLLMNYWLFISLDYHQN